MKYSFRTEMSCDDEFVPEVLEIMDVEDYHYEQVSDSNFEAYKMGKFTFESDKDLYTLKVQMNETLGSDKRFWDMHRCVQTLAEGDTPNEQWYLS